jgi:hypothetical protein
MTREEAIKKLKEWDFLNTEELDVIQTLVPELKEDYDDRIREEIINFFDDCINSRTRVTTTKQFGLWKSYFEKIKTQSLDKNGWSDMDDIYLGDVLWCIEKAMEMAKDENDMGTCWSAENWVKSIKYRNLSEAKNEDSYVTSNKDFFNFIYNRLKEVHGENPDVDYMRSFRERIDSLFG